ncbi:glycosyltransferase family 2 protein [Gluconobacter cerinus]|uniref:glycosyltransferase family 2 protein n=1 Tax=Gluconobacter cerinus TaxID=38307 RepID=UPI003AB1DEA0
MSKNALKCSFIVPAYNVQKYLEKCIESLQKQSLDSFEIILVEDCSLDGTLALAQRLSSKDNRIRLIRHKKNQGLGPARNTGLAHAQGKYICFVDSDDWVDPGYGESFYLEAERTNADMIVGSFYAVFSQGARIAPHFVDPMVRYASLPFNARTCPAVLSMPTPVWDKCYRREFLEQHNLRFPALIGEDIPFQWAAMTQAERMSVVGEPFYYYRIRDSQKNRSLTAGRDIFADVFLAQEKALNFLKSNGYYEEFKAIWWERMIKELLHLTEKSADTLISDRFVAKVFHMMLCKSLASVDFSMLNRAYVPDHILFKAMFALQCETWKDFQDFVRRSTPTQHKRPVFFNAGKIKLALIQHNLDLKEDEKNHLLTIAEYKISRDYYSDLPDYAAASCDGHKIILLPPVHDSEMEAAKVRVTLKGQGSKRLWYFIACAQEARSAELAIFQRILGENQEVIAEQETVLPVGTKILLSSLELPNEEKSSKFTFEFFVKCLSGFPAWASDVTISNFYGEGA